ncbi:MAG: ATP-binding protein [Terricaulis sp.]
MQRTSWKAPFNTLTGRMVLVTIAAVIVSYAIALVMFSNERGAAIRRAAETNAVERIAYTTERIRSLQPAQRIALAQSLRDFGTRYEVSATPAATANAGDAGQRIARALSERLSGVESYAQSRTVEVQPRFQRTQPHFHGDDGGAPGQGAGVPHPGGPGAGPMDADDPGGGPPPADGPSIRSTEAVVSVRLDQASWLNATVRLPGPRPAPFSVLMSAFVAIVLVGAGAALISRQIGQPLAKLADAARALGAGNTNVTAPVSGPDDVQRASMAFNAMAERLGRQLNRQREMLWALSHDLRTPITALRLRAELVEDDATKQRLLAPIEEMERLTEQALSLARAGASEEERVSVDLADLTRTLAGELQDIGLNVKANAATPLIVECRPSEIARALRNLAENAVKYAGGGTVDVYRDANGDAVAEVRDEGPGVPAEQLPRLTAPFFRADAARSEESGAGLGLAIVQAIADGHGGKLVLANRQPHGLSAKLILPG